MAALELPILDWIQTWLRTPLGDAVLPLVTRLGDHGLIWIGLTLVLLALPKTRKLGCAVAAGLLLDLVCCDMLLKPLVARVRPCDLNAAVQLLIPRPSDFSFPSGHTASAFAAVSALYFCRSKLWMPAAALAALIAFSRLYLYVHFPTDVAAGLLLGIALGAAGARLADALTRKLSQRRPASAPPPRQP